MTNQFENQGVEYHLQETFSRKKIGLWGWLFVVLGFCGFVLWAAFAPLDNGVALPGTVTVAGHRQAVDATSGGTVKTLYIKDGSEVKQGQLLLELDSTIAHNNMQSLSIQQKSLQSKIARLQAEQQQLEQIHFSKNLEQDKQVETRVAISAQQQLFYSRKATLQSEMQAITKNINGLQALLIGLQSALEQKKSQIQSLEQQLSNIRELANQGYVPRNRLLELERQHAQLQAELARDLGVIGQTRQQIAELTAKMHQTQQAFFQQVNDDLANSQLQLQDVSSKLESAQFELTNYQIKAPSAGVVVGLNVYTVGSMVSVGQRMMEIVPTHAPLLVEGQLPVNQIDRVKKGLAVELLFNAFNQSTTPRINGVVQQVSADRLIDEKTAIPYYKIQIAVANQQVERLGYQKLLAGMPVEIFVKTGERSLLNYLFKPLLDRSKTSWGDS